MNISYDREQDYFVDGISEELLNLLSQVPELRVIARNSSFSFKGKEADIATIARTLDVTHVLAGSVRKSGDKLRITAQLIRASDSSHLWSQAYVRQLTDVFDIQDDIAAAVVNALKIRLLGATPGSKANVPEAYRLFLRAREVGRQYTATAFEEAVSLYGQALAIDRDYVEAWLGLAVMYCNQVIEAPATPEAGIPAAREAIQGALARDPLYALSHFLEPAAVHGILGIVTIVGIGIIRVIKIPSIICR